ncbi:unnamed protein product [Gordionus sp. m RMFG-2023]
MAFLYNFITSISQRLFVIKAAETPDDPVIALREKCSQHTACRKYKKRYEVCSERVNKTPGTDETCEEELFDFLHHRDQCVAKELFNYLK